VDECDEKVRSLDYSVCWHRGRHTGETCLTDLVVDQAALLSLLRVVCEVGIPFLSAIRVAPGQKGVRHMNTSRKITGRRDRTVILSTLWLFATLNYIYCDVVAVMDPVKRTPFQLTPGFLLGASILVEIPIAMVILSRVLKYGANRWANIIAGTIMTAVQILSLFVAVPAMYYVFFSVVEIACTLFIVGYAWSWSHPQGGVLSRRDQGSVPVEAKKELAASSGRAAETRI
jgi:hypothetical protein